MSPLPAPSQVCQHPCTASPQGRDCLTCLENSAGVAKIRPQHGASTSAPPWARLSHGERWEGLDYWSSGSLPGLPCAASQLLRASSHHPTPVPALLLRPAAKHCPVQEPARLSPRPRKGSQPLCAGGWSCIRRSQYGPAPSRPPRAPAQPLPAPGQEELEPAAPCCSHSLDSSISDP